MAKVINLNKDENIEQLKEKLYGVQQERHGLDAGKYSGVLKIKEDPIAYQKRIRNEWN